MKPTDEEAGLPQPSPVKEEEAAARIYESVGAAVLGTLPGKFGLPPEEVETLLGTMCAQAVQQTVQDFDAWTIAAMSNGVKTLRRWRDEGTAAPPADVTLEEIMAMRGVALVGKALSTITEQGRKALRLRFREGWSYADIASELDVTQRYVERLVSKSLARLRAFQRAGGEGE